MKKLVWKLVLPLTILSFLFISKEWYVNVVDGPDHYMRGFPLIYESPGFHTSLSLQIFMMELLFDFLFYFLIWFLLVFFVDKYLLKIKVGVFIDTLLKGFTFVTICFYINVICIFEVEFKVKRDFNIEVKSTTCQIFGV